MDRLTPYPTNDLANAVHAGGGVLNLILGIKSLKNALESEGQMRTTQSMPLGEALGYGKPQQTIVPTPGPMREFAGAVMTPAMGTEVPNTGFVTPSPRRAFPTAPEALQPLMSQNLGELSRTRQLMGDDIMKSLLGVMGLKNGQGSELTWDGRAFSLPAGPVSPKAAGVIQRQQSLMNAGELNSIRRRAQLRLEDKGMNEGERIKLRADIEMLNLLGDDVAMMDIEENTPAVAAQLRSELPALLERMKNYGVSTRPKPTRPPTQRIAHQFKSAAEVKAAFKAKKIDEQTAKAILVQDFQFR